MRYMIMFKTDKDAEDTGPACFLNPDMGVFINRLRDEGVLVHTEGLRPSYEMGARLRRSGGKVSITDGPFAEAKELVAGFVLVEVPSREAAVELAGRFLEIAGDANAEVREVIGAPH